MKTIILDQRIEDTNFRVEPWVGAKENTRIRNALQRAGIHTVDALAELTRQEIEAIPGIGIVCTVIVCKKLATMGLRPKGDQ